MIVDYIMGGILVGGACLCCLWFFAEYQAWGNRMR
jgi:hypothetical protein